MNNLSNEYTTLSHSSSTPRIANVLPLRQVVLFPGTEMTLDVGRRTSKAAVRHVGSEDYLLLLTQKEVDVESPKKDDFYLTGTLAKVLEVVPQATLSGMRIVVKVLSRATLLDELEEEPYIQASWTHFETQSQLPDDDLIYVAYSRKLTAELVKFSRMTGRVNQEQLNYYENLPDLEARVDFLSSILLTDLEERYQVLEESMLEKRYEKILSFLVRENELIGLEADLNNKLKIALDKSQREYYLREKMKVINEELGEAQDKETDIAEFRKRIQDELTDEKVKKKLHKEVDRLARLSTASPDYGNLVNYIEFALDLPWARFREENQDIQHAEKILNEDHYGLKKIKDRILEFLAVRALNPEHQGSIICLVGPPGVGKTSLAKSIARATNRDYVRLSLGGIQDEAEIRGHRRTYVGALPGRLLAGLSDCGTANPVFLLDEVDKLNRDFRGDPASALLEVLDPAQNNTFRDHYLDLPFDLSRVFFITTANSMHTIPGPLKDRMEIIELSSYTEPEKLEIAKRYIVPRQIKEQGLSGYKISVSEGALSRIISEYTAEAGVRELERKVGKIMRRAARCVLESKETDTIRVTKRNLEEFLDKPRKHQLTALKEDAVGVAVGLAWTPVGGEILHIETQVMPGKGKLQLTGHLGDIMKESAQLAISVVRSHSDVFNIADDFFETHDIHLHVPQGAVPKDGPSAGAALATSILSAVAGRKIKSNVAMTGEITLRGRILEVGGIRDKVIAAHRAGCCTVLLPVENKQDLEEIPAVIKEELNISFVSHVEEVWAQVLVEMDT